MMEGHGGEEVVEMGMGGSSGSSRWNPTKEQISMLENLYKQGIRTPTAEEIQQITARLRAYGHIEGKNVFYWFQNHKARQRQKQKQETIAYFNRFLHRPQPLFSPPICPNVICAPYCMPHQAQSSEIGFYPAQQHAKVLVPLGIRRSPNEKVAVPMPSMCNGPMVYEGIMQQQGISSDCSSHQLMNYSNQEKTLDLFPLHPTGILEAKATDNKLLVSSSLASSSVSADGSTDTPSACSPEHINKQHGYSGTRNQPFFDFFTSGQGPP